MKKRLFLLMALALLSSSYLRSQITAPFTQSFDSLVIPHGWSNTGTGILPNAHWKFTGTPGNPSMATSPAYVPSVVLDHTQNSGGIAWSDGSNPIVADCGLLTDSIDVSSLTSLYLQFYYYSNNVGNAATGNNTLRVDFYDGATWHDSVFLYSGNGVNWQEGSVDLSTYPIYGKILFEFVVDQTTMPQTINAYYNDILLDDIFVGDAPACGNVQNLTVSNVTSFKADLKWDTVAGATGYEVFYGQTGFTPGGPGSTSMVVTTDSLNLSNLSHSTDYQFYVMSICDTSSFGAIIGPVAFRTSCGLVTAPYNENFDGSNWLRGSNLGLGDAIDPCWTITPNDDYQYNWSVFNAPTIYTSTGPNTDVSGTGDFLYTAFAYSGAGLDAYLISPFIDLGTLTTPYLEFYSHRYGSTLGDMDVDVNDGSGWVTMLTLTGQEQTSSVAPWKLKVVDLSSFGDTVQIRFVASYLTCCSGAMAIDEFSIVEAPTCFPTSGQSISGISDSAASLTWDTTSSTLAYQIWVGPQNFYQGTATTKGSMALHLSDSIYTDTLSPNTCYDYYLRSICVVGDTSAWVGPFSWCTPCSSYGMPYYEDFNSTPFTCWDMTGGTNNWGFYIGNSGDNWAAANLRTTTNADFYMTSPVVSISGKAEIFFEWSHLFDTLNPNDQLLVVVHKMGTNSKDTIINLMGAINFNDPTSTDRTPGSGVATTYPLDSAQYYNATIRVEFIALSGTGSSLFVNNFAIRPTVSNDMEIVNGEFLRNDPCYTTNDTIILDVVNNVGTTVNFATTPLTSGYAVTGPINTNGTITVNTGTLLPGDTVRLMATNIDMSLPGNYTLNAHINSSAANLSTYGDTLLMPSTSEVKSLWSAEPDTVVVITNITDTVDLKVNSPYFSGGTFFITEQCQYQYSAGAPLSGWNSYGYLAADDYIEITGAPNTDLEGITLEQWNASGIVSTYTFPQGTLLSPNGTAIIAVGTVSGSNPSPANFYYHGNGNYTGTWGSSTASGRLLKDSKGNIIDAVISNSFTWPAASGVTSADWSGTMPATGSTSGNRLEGPDMNGPAGWVSSSTSVQKQDPNTVNGGVVVPAPKSIAGFTWTLNGIVIDTLPQTMVGPYTANGVHNYIANYTGPCGVLSDTVTVVVSIPGLCPVPLNVQTNVVSCEEVDINWNNSNDSSLVGYMAAGATTPTYTWVIMDSSYTINGLSPNTSYNVYVAHFCNGDTTFGASSIAFNTGNVSAPTASYTAAPVANTLDVNFDASASTGANNNYNWDFGDGSTGTGVTVNHTYATGGAHCIKLTVTNTCGSSDSTFCLSPFFNLVENDLSRSLNIFPNPAQNQVTISFSSEYGTQARIRIIDLSGKEVMVISDRISGGIFEKSLNLNNLAEGVYFIEISDGNLRTTRKIVRN